jgi:hypothetical protein
MSAPDHKQETNSAAVSGELVVIGMPVVVVGYT